MRASAARSRVSSALALLPLPPTKAYRREDLRPDLLAALAVVFLTVPQGLAYATIAGLPPVMGLYAAALPTIVGAIFRSSRHVMAGPTNAVSLLVGAAIAGASADPATVAITLALMVGLLQAGAGLLRLGTLVDYISSPVVRGYITGAAALIGLGQLHNLSGTQGLRDTPWHTLSGWISELPRAQPVPLAIGLGTALAVLALRWVAKRSALRLPDSLIALAAAILVVQLLGLERHGLRIIRDLSPIPAALPPLTLPRLDLIAGLVPVAVACAVLSLVESSAVARSLAAKHGDRIESSTEFFGQGLANIAAAFTGGYPVSGSLARSALNAQAGAQTRLSGIASGAMMLPLIALIGPVLEHTPIAALAGLLFVLAADLVDVPGIRRIMRTTRGDALTFGVTVLATWLLSLDQAIYLGVGLSMVFYLRKARLLIVTELAFDEAGDLFEVSDTQRQAAQSDQGIRYLHLEGELFFGAASELTIALEAALEDPELSVLVLRLKRAKHLDVTASRVFSNTLAQLRARGAHLLLCGMTPSVMEVLERSGVAREVGAENLFPTRNTFFAAVKAARERAQDLVAEG